MTVEEECHRKHHHKEQQEEKELIAVFKKRFRILIAMLLHIRWGRQERDGGWIIY